MKKRNPLLIVILAFVTAGIYELYWLYVTRQEMVKRGVKIPSFWPLLLPLLLIVAAVVHLVVNYINTSVDEVSLTNTALILIGLAALIGIPYWLYFIYRYCAGVEKVTRKKMTQMTAFLLFIVLMLVSVGTGSTSNIITWVGGLVSSLWPGIIQNSFNKAPASKKSAR